MPGFPIFTKEPTSGLSKMKIKISTVSSDSCLSFCARGVMGIRIPAKTGNFINKGISFRGKGFGENGQQARVKMLSVSCYPY
jgi:hypothetical protein